MKIISPMESENDYCVKYKAAAIFIFYAHSLSLSHTHTYLYPTTGSLSTYPSLSNLFPNSTAPFSVQANEVDDARRLRASPGVGALAIVKVRPRIQRRKETTKKEPVKRTKPGRGNDLTRSRNVLTKMERTFGPLGALYRYMQSRTRVKIYTRNERGIRGHVEAYVVAFDKHWNLALEDCFEVWTRKVKRKAPALGPPDSIKLPDDMPRTVVKESNGKIETLERHVTQLLLRGEQIAIIMKID
ncbi:U7 snRNA-associated Sm-like protein LSm11 isoform X1 [Cephus cinctus]|uniref:U7 snRNA-associated Sm-like protein LSm11 isoform X1 n=1 Tax=Cephus cinctus TaxID=211228 RepID=A0AAJ7W614_CEPCN|nr:U7 snRNA-associated Sm-like protein LSm11 isoform X1 [Cephus cinctus]